jgi:hypothetical protein
MKNKKLRDAFLSEAWAELQRWEEKYQQLEELMPIFDAMKRAKK